MRLLSWIWNLLFYRESKEMRVSKALGVVPIGAKLISPTQQGRSFVYRCTGWDEIPYEKNDVLPDVMHNPGFQKYLTDKYFGRGD